MTFFMDAIGVVYLLRAQNGIAPVQTFAESYARYSGGEKHALIVVCKGFDSVRAMEPYEACFAGFKFDQLHVPDKGFDIAAYFRAVEQFPFSRFCFLNSFSVLLDEHWLAKLAENIGHEDIGAVGATGSWESIYNNILIEKQSAGSSGILQRLTWPLRMALARRWFPPFPNHHLRTNAVMATRMLLGRLQVPPLRCKMDAMRFETGWQGFTRQIEAMGKMVLVVGKDGRGYDKNEWNQSRTFRHGQQENLLVSDNRTRQYAQALPEQKRALAFQAWGQNG